MADLTLVPGDIQTSPAAKIASGDAAVVIEAGQLVYKTTLNKWGLADANGASPLYKVAGMAIDGAGVDQPLDVVLEDPDLTIGGTDPVGTVLIASATPGGICPEADAVSGWNKSVVGIITAPGHVNFKITRSDAPVP